jgi:hypothetical protein
MTVHQPANAVFILLAISIYIVTALFNLKQQKEPRIERFLLLQLKIWG